MGKYPLYIYFFLTLALPSHPLQALEEGGTEPETSVEESETEIEETEASETSPSEEALLPEDTAMPVPKDRAAELFETDADREDLGLGIQFGFNASDAWISNVPSGYAFLVNAQSRLSAGVLLEYQFNALFFIRPELKIIRKINSVYLELPILLGIEYSIGPPVSLIGLIGPAPSLKLTSNTDESLDLGLQIGGGIEVDLEKNVVLTLDVRYSFGLLTYRQMNPTSFGMPAGPNLLFKNAGLQVHATLVFF